MAHGKGSSDVTRLVMAVCGPSARLSENLYPIQPHFSLPETTENPTQCCSSAQGKGRQNSFLALSSCLFQCVVLEAAHSRKRSRETKGLGRLGKGQAPLLWVNPVSEQACKERGGPTGGLESGDPQMHVTPVVSLETCYVLGPGLRCVGNSEVNQILILKSLYIEG